MITQRQGTNIITKLKNRHIRGAALAAAMFLAAAAAGYAKGALVETDSVNWSVSNAELEKLPTDPNKLQLILNLPSLSDSRCRSQDLLGAKENLEKSASHLDGYLRGLPAKTSLETKEFISDDLTLTREMAEQADGHIAGLNDSIERIEIISSPQEAPYGESRFVSKAGAINYILSSREKDWQNENIPFGRLGFLRTGRQWDQGFMQYTGEKQDWFKGRGAGEMYGIGGPVIAWGALDNKPSFSIFDSGGVLMGYVTKDRLKYDPDLTAKYLIQAQHSSQANFQGFLGNQTPNYLPSFHRCRRHIRLKGFQPYSVMVEPLGMGYGDIYQTSYVLNDKLLASRGNYKKDTFEEATLRCFPPYMIEDIFDRLVQEPDDPLYYKAPMKKGGVAGAAKNILGGALKLGGIGLRTGSAKKGPDISDQYGIREIGFLPRSDFDSAWNVYSGSEKNVLVAVIDSGLDLAHPDGPQFVWMNPGEVPNNSIDDDNNGYVDDAHGWNFVDDDNDLTDYKGHGTLVSGIIAAKTNNGTGIAGINPGAVIMVLKVADKFGNTDSLDIFRAIGYALKYGARVINISLGGRGVSKLEQLAINRARSLGALVVVASGNDGENISFYGPASDGQALAVGALNYDGTRSTISNWGPNNALLAPGEQIYSLHSKDAPWEGPAADKKRLYTKASGTSFAAPMVSATASLLLAKDPSLGPGMAEDILLSSATKMGDEEWDAKTGAGKLNAARALRADPRETKNVRITALTVNRDAKTNKPDSVDVFATVRVARLDYFTVEMGRGQRPRKFKTIIGFYRQNADNELVARIDAKQLKADRDWVVLIRAVDETGKEFIARSELKYDK